MKNKRKTLIEKETKVDKANKTKIIFFSMLSIIVAIIFISFLFSDKTNADLDNNKDLQTLRISVKIPCPGHALLISQNIKSLPGIANIDFDLPNIFEIKYDSQKTSRQEILSLNIFKTYSAKTLN